MKLFNSTLPKSIYDSQLDSSSTRPNYSLRPDNTKIDTIVIHYTVTNFIDSYRIFTKERDVSIHYVINENGEIHQIVNEAFKAWHSGVSHWQGKDSVNNFSIGIELINPGSGTQECYPTRFDELPEENQSCTINHFTNQQYKALIALISDIKTRHSIENILGHSDVAPGRKIEPGPFFNWTLLSEAGHGPIFSGFNKEEDLSLDEKDSAQIESLQHRLKNFGYKVDCNGEFDVNLANVIRAFKFHYAQDSKFKWDIWTNMCEFRLQELKI